jgi:FAD/FMN-containing dehydrogenase
MTFPSSLLDTLRQAVGAAHVLTEGDLAAYEQDWRRREYGKALAVVRPGSTAEVAAVVRACAAQGVAIVPQGGNTGCRWARCPTAAAARWC